VLGRPLCVGQGFSFCLSVCLSFFLFLLLWLTPTCFSSSFSAGFAWLWRFDAQTSKEGSGETGHCGYGVGGGRLGRFARLGQAYLQTIPKFAMASASSAAASSASSASSSSPSNAIPIPRRKTHGPQRPPRPSADSTPGNDFAYGGCASLGSATGSASYTPQNSPGSSGGRTRLMCEHDLPLRILPRLPTQHLYRHLSGIHLSRMKPSPVCREGNTIPLTALALFYSSDIFPSRAHRHQHRRHGESAPGTFVLFQQESSRSQLLTLGGLRLPVSRHRKALIGIKVCVLSFFHFFLKKKIFLIPFNSPDTVESGNRWRAREPCSSN